MKLGLKFLGSIIIIITLVVSIFNFDNIFHPIYETINTDYSTDILSSNNSFSSILIRSKYFIEDETSSTYLSNIRKDLNDIKGILNGKDIFTIHDGNDNIEDIRPILAIEDDLSPTFEGWLNRFGKSIKDLFKDISIQASSNNNPLYYICNLFLNFIPLLKAVCSLLFYLSLLCINYFVFIISFL